jgi:effector-binding domain-containing protein
MKVLKWIGILIIVLIVGYLIFSATQPNQLIIEKSISIEANAEKIYSELIDFPSWDNWSSWDQLDSNMKSEYSDKMGVVGAYHQWWSNHPKVGNGKQEVVELKTNKYLNSKMTFEGFDLINHAEFTLEEGDDSTLVRWTYNGGKTPFYLNALNTFIKPELEMNFEKSLKQLKHYIEAQGSEIQMPEGVELVELEDQAIISITDSTDASRLSKLLGQLYTELGIYASTTDGLETMEMPLAIYHNYSPEKVVIEAVRYISGNGENKGRVKVKTLSGGPALKGVFYGDYDASESMHIMIDDYINSSSYEMIGSPWEYYANDPTLVDSAEIETHIYYPVRKK